jgi:hypothetical protein
LQPKTHSLLPEQSCTDQKDINLTPVIGKTGKCTIVISQIKVGYARRHKELQNGQEMMTLTKE